MRTYFLISIITVAFLSSVTFIQAQQPGVAINTNGNTSHSSAMLDVQSTEKGFLLPRMTTAQMYAIPAPAGGLMVFNTSYNELYQYNGTSWRPILNGNYWLRPITSRDIISNTADSIGIGLSVPTRKLDVNGTMRVRDNVTADEAVSAKTLIASGNLTVAGTGLVNGSLQSNDQVVINNSSAILQLKDGADNKGYFQLSGNDVRVGTNVGNSNGNFIVRMNGTERIKVEPQGDVDINGKVWRSDRTGYRDLLPVAYGVVSREGVLLSASSTNNVSIVHRGEGQYSIVLNQYVPNAMIQLTPMYEYYEVDGYGYISGSAIMHSRVYSSNQSPASTTIHVSALGIDLGGGLFYWDNKFSFLIYGN